MDASILIPWYFAFYEDLNASSKIYEIVNLHRRVNNDDHIIKDDDIYFPRSYYYSTRVDLEELSENDTFFWLRRREWVKNPVPEVKPKNWFLRLFHSYESGSFEETTVASLEIKYNNRVEIHVFGEKFMPEITQLIESLKPSSSKRVTLVLKQRKPLWS